MHSDLQPWIEDYVVGVAEQLGANFFNAPYHPKWKTVQIIEILHRGTEGQESNVWARISDSFRSITAKFTPEAATNYLVISQNKRLTQHQITIIRIKDFKLFFGRVPVQENKMTLNETIALECASAKPHGSSGEKKVGSPQDITTHRDIREWIDGLRKGGGEGNILREQRIERERKRLADNVGDKQLVPMVERRKLDLVAHKTVEKPVAWPDSSKLVPMVSSESHKLNWKPKMPSFYEIPTEILVALSALPIEGEEPQSSPESLKNGAKELARSHKRRRLDDGNSERYAMEFDVDEVDERSSQPLSDWSQSGEDEPALKCRQRQRTSPEQDPVTLGGVQKMDDRTSAVQNSPLPSSHRTTAPSPTLPPMSSYAKIEAPLSPSKSTTNLVSAQNPRLRVMRRVSPPRQPQELTQSSGPERILVPASDTSMSQSQSQSQRRHFKSEVGGSSVGGLGEENTKMLEPAQEMAKQSSTRQVARKALTNGLVKRETDNGGESERKSHGIPGSEKADDEKMSEDDEEIDERIFNDRGMNKMPYRALQEELRMDMEKRPPSKMGNNNSTRASPNGHDPVSPWITAVSEMETRVQHEPGTWDQPSFMKKKKKLGGLEVRLEGIVKEEEGIGAWVSWGELNNILKET